MFAKELSEGDRFAAGTKGEILAQPNGSRILHSPSSALPRMQPIKQLMKASGTLLQPPAPLPGTADELLDRVSASDEPTADALGPASLLDTSFCSCRPSPDHRRPSPDAHPRQSLDQAHCMVIDRSCALLAASQKVLLAEFDPEGRKQEWQADDYLLGTADRRLLRAMIDLAVDRVLLLVQRFLGQIKQHQGERLDALHDITLFLLDLSLISPAPSNTASGSNDEIAKWLPATFITDYLRYSGHVARILLAAILVGWLPTAPPTHHKPLRDLVMRFVGSQPSMAAVIGDLAKARLLFAHKFPAPAPVLPGMGNKAKDGWSQVVWPKFVSDHLTRLQSRAVGQPGGLKAFIRTFLEGLRGRYPSDQDISVFCRAVSTPPQGFRPADWANTIVDQACHVIMAEPAASSDQQQQVNPIHHAAAHVIDACYTQDPVTVLVLLKATIIHPLAAPAQTDANAWLAQTAGGVHVISLFCNSTLKRSQCLAALMVDSGFKTLYVHLEAIRRGLVPYSSSAPKSGNHDLLEVLQGREYTVRTTLVSWMEVAQTDELVSVLVDLAEEGLPQDLAPDSTAAQMASLQLADSATPEIRAEHIDPKADTDNSHITNHTPTSPSTGAALLLDLMTEASCHTAIFALLCFCAQQPAGSGTHRCLDLIKGVLRSRPILIKRHDNASELFAAPETDRPGDLFLVLRGHLAVLDLLAHEDVEIANRAKTIKDLLSRLSRSADDSPIPDFHHAITQFESNDTGTRQQALVLLTKVVLRPGFSSAAKLEIRDAIMGVSDSQGKDHEQEHTAEWTALLLRYVDAVRDYNHGSPEDGRTRREDT